MPRTFLCIGLAFLAGLLVPITYGQPSPGEVAGPDQEYLDQIRNIREGIVDPNARPEDRWRWAELLLSYSSPQGKALVVELLVLSDRVDVQRALCGVIAERARQAPERLDAWLVEPLIELLGAGADDLRVLAAGALADFPGADVPIRLGTLASRTDAPLPKRLAAIDALAPNGHRREVVAQLIGLLDAGVPEITERAVAALETATPETFGLDLDRWRTWWDGQAQLDEKAWLAGQLKIYRERSRRVADELRTFREMSRRDYAAITTRTRTFQRELFRALTADQREAKLVQWLADPLPVVKLMALSIIKSRIADEGKRPEGDVLVALLSLLTQESAEMRREVLDIAQNLNVPAVVGAVLAQLQREDDPSTRLSIFKALGKLDNAAALPALVSEIAAENSLPECVREAAIALGRVASRCNDEEELQGAVTALKKRYRSSLDEDVHLRAALLNAMAGVADSAATPEFLEAIESDDAAVLRPAIRGVLAVGDTSNLARLRALAAHADPLVRLAAIDAVGELGREDADLESLLTRLNPSIETNELARQAAWRGFRKLLSYRSVRDRITAAGRLRDLPDLEVTYLEELADALSTVNSDTADLEAVLDRLITALVTQARYEAAVGYLRTLRDLLLARADPGAFECGVRLVDATLRNGSGSGLTELIMQLAASAADDASRARIIDTVDAYLQSAGLTPGAERTNKLLADLRAVPGDTLGEAWTQLLEQAADRLDPAETTPTPSPPPPGD